jgi:hypothetical protein
VGKRARSKYNNNNTNNNCNILFLLKSPSADAASATAAPLARTARVLGLQATFASQSRTVLCWDPCRPGPHHRPANGVSIGKSQASVLGGVVPTSGDDPHARHARSPARVGRLAGTPPPTVGLDGSECKSGTSASDRVSASVAQVTA